MALPPGGPQGGLESVAEYNAQLLKERQSAQQPPSQSQESERKEESPKLSAEESKAAAIEANLAENERNAAKQLAQRFAPNAELTDKAQASIDAKAEKFAAEQKHDRSQDDRAKANEQSYDFEKS